MYKGSIKKHGDSLTLKEKGTTDVDPRPSSDEDEGNKIPPKALKPDENEIEEITLVQVTNKVIKVSKILSQEIKADLANLMKENADLFVWSVANMPGIDLTIITHKLNVIEGSKSVKQKKRSMALENDKVVVEEVQKILDIVLVSKVTGGWRMCIDFSNLNKACPNDFYPLQRIN